MYEYLDDIEFLTKLDKVNIRVHYAKIVLLSFDEKPIKEIQGTITSGTLNVNGSSAVRRTINLSMLAAFNNSNIEDIDNEISINKKLKIFVGLKNPFKTYEKYGDIVWFPMGMFIISSANITRNTNGWSISITGKDKMALLDGTAGGVLPASITFHEKLIELDNGDYEIQHPTIFQIIYEAVNHWGGEAAENIIITGLDEKAKMLVKYMGDSPIYFSDDYKSLSFQEVQGSFEKKCVQGQDAGYKETDFTYPGELILKAGDTVVTLLDKITKLLGNYEYFYDINGKFVFQQIENYLNTYSPLTELTEESENSNAKYLQSLTEENYIKNYNNAKYLYSLTQLDTTTAVSRNPKYDQIKNDFYVWGSRKTTSGVEVDIRYHLAIDAKPDIYFAGQYMWEVKKDNTLIRYEFTSSPDTYHRNDKYIYTYTMIAPPCNEWREELYRRALVAQVTNSVYDNYYDSELVAEWRHLYDPNNPNWEDGWNPAIREDPKSINFWLDFIDTGSELGKYSINKIGRRTKVVNNKELKSIYNMEVPDVIFIEGFQPTLIDKYTKIGQDYFILTPEYYDLFQISSTGASCFDQIREMMYQNLAYNTTITITCLPKYYMEVNNIIHIEDEESGINGNYQITQFSLPLAYSGTMSITATEVLTRI